MTFSSKQKIKTVSEWFRVKLFGPESSKVHLLNISIGISTALIGVVIGATALGVFYGRHWVWGTLLQITGTKQAITDNTGSSPQSAGSSASQNSGNSGNGSGGSGGGGDGNGGDGECPPGDDCPCPPHTGGPGCKSRDFTEIGWAIPCSYAYSIKDDPILDFGKPGTAALNDFRGNTSANANSTYDSLSANKSDWTCNFKPGWDHSASYSPHMYLNGSDYPTKTLFTYHLSPKGIDPKLIEPLPAGIQLVADSDHVTWSCAYHNNDVSSNKPTDCNGLTNPRDPSVLSEPDAWVTLPYCWDGKGQGYNHTVYTTDNHACPADHPHVLPRIRFQFGFNVPNQDASGATFATADGQNNARFFAEFYEAWDPAAMTYLTTNCLVAQINCGSVANSCGRIYKTLGIWDEDVCGKNKHA